MDEPQLPSTESRLLAATETVVDFSSSVSDENSLDSAQSWGPDRTISGKLLAAVARGEQHIEENSRRTLHIRGARVVGLVDLRASEISSNLILESCSIEGGIDLTEATIKSVEICDSRVAHVDARGARLSGSFVLTGIASSRLNAHGVDVTGNVILDRSQFSNPGKTSLNLGGATIGGALSCTDGFSSTGQVFLIGAKVEGSVSFTGATLRNEDGWAINAQGMWCGYALFLGSSLDNDGGLEVIGGVRLIGVEVDGFACFWGTKITGDERVPYALTCLGMRVRENLMLDTGFTLKGILDLRNVEIGDEITMRGARIEGINGEAIIAERATVGDDICFTDGFLADGSIELRHASVGGVVDFTDSNLAVAKVSVAQAKFGSLVLKPKEPPAEIDAQFAEIGILDDSIKSWGRRYWLRGFGYKGLVSTETSPKRRAEWVGRDCAGYSPQPYLQLASVYRFQGEVEAARSVELAMRRKRRSTLDWLGRLVGWLFDVLVGYGYQAWRAGLYLAALWIAGGMYFGSLAAGRLQPTSAASPALNVWAYSIDVLLPIVDLGQESSWKPTDGVPLYVSWALVTSGWLLTTAFVAGLPVLSRRE